MSTEDGEDMGMSPVTYHQSIDLIYFHHFQYSIDGEIMSDLVPKKIKHYWLEDVGFE